jgi:hypothetical protein
MKHLSSALWQSVLASGLVIGCTVQGTDFTGKTCASAKDCPAPFVCGSLQLGAGACQLLDAGRSTCSPGGPELSCPSSVPEINATDVQNQVMNPVCSNCHAPGGGGVDAPFEWDTVDKTVAAVGQASTYRGTSAGSPLKVVDPNNLRTSTMYLKSIGGSPAFTGPNCESVGGSMPQSPYSPLSDAQKAVLKNWICGGARR